MLRMSVFASALAASAAFAFAATDDELNQQILGSWGEEETCAGGTLTFNPDGTYTIVLADDDPESGTWSITDGVITATDQPVSTVTIEGETLTMGDPKGGPRKETFVRCPE